MTPLFFHMITSAIRAITLFVLLNMVVKFRVRYNLLQRLGLSFTASGALMTIPVLYFWPDVTPFDAWSTTVMSVGMLMFMWGSALRDYKHSFGNEEQVNVSKEYLKERGLL